MAPPDRKDEPRDYTPLEEAKLTVSKDSDTDVESRMLPTAERFVSWLEWLLHPEEHDHDRTVTTPTGAKKEAESNVVTGAPGDMAELPYESVIAGYEIWQFLHGMTAVATQRVERPDTALIAVNAAMQNVRWSADTYVMGLGDQLEATGWKGDASRAASGYIARLVNAVVELRKFGDAFAAIVMKYATVITGARTDLTKAADAFTQACQDKFYNRDNDVSFDVEAIALAGITAAATTLLPGAKVVEAIDEAMKAVWSDAFSQTTKSLLGSFSKVGNVSGPLWREMAQSYMHTQAVIMTDAKETIDSLNDQVRTLIAGFDANGPIRDIINAP